MVDNEWVDGGSELVVMLKASTSEAERAAAWVRPPAGDIASEVSVAQLLVDARFVGEVGHSDDAALHAGRAVQIWERVRLRGMNPSTLRDRILGTPALRNIVVGAYVKPRLRPMIPGFAARQAAMAQAQGGERDYRALQKYLEGPDKGGMNVLAARGLGISGKGVTIADVEGAWVVDHEDLPLEGAPRSFPLQDKIDWRLHGTSVLGVLVARNDELGVTGIAPEARVVLGPIDADETGSSGAMDRALELLHEGDVLLVELQRGHPTGGSAIPIEWWPSDFAVIRRATDRGVVVVEAAGNGARDLDDAVYDRRRRGFPASWRNPFRAVDHPSRDSGAILVGGGLLDASRRVQSNYGSRVDVQAWATSVTTTGGGGLYGAGTGGIPETQWYTSDFNGTSAAAAIVAGVVCCMQEYAKRVLDRPLTPAEARRMLRRDEHGVAQAGAEGRPASQRIGPRPDLQKLFEAIDAMR